jgi:ERCC4-type nuclease
MIENNFIPSHHKNITYFYLQYISKIQQIMLIISSREFQNNPMQYFNRIDSGEQVIIQRGKNKAYSLNMISKADLYFTPEMIRKIEHSIQQAKEGKVTTVKGKQELHRFFDGL